MHVYVVLSVPPHVCFLPYLLFVSSRSLFAFCCLPFITGWIPKCKMSAERERERVAYIFNRGLLYFNKPFFSRPSFGSMRREDEETDGGENINKLHTNECESHGHTHHKVRMLTTWNSWILLSVGAYCCFWLATEICWKKPVSSSVVVSVLSCS